MASTIRMARLASRRPAWRDWIFCGAGGAAVGGLVMSTHLQSPAASGTERSMVMGACQATLGNHVAPSAHVSPVGHAVTGGVTGKRAGSSRIWPLETRAKPAFDQIRVKQR